MNDIRKIMGFCPQHDVLFPDLSVIEHLRLFAVFKGADPTKCEEEIRKSI